MSKDSENLRILLLFEKRALFRASLARLLEGLDAFEIAAECETKEAALDALQTSPVDIILLKCDATLAHCCEFMTAARQAGYDGQFLMISENGTPELIANSLRLGAAGIFLESEAPERLAQAIRLVANGGIWMDASVVQRLAEKTLDKHPGARQTSPEALDERERTVLMGILEGLTNKKIGTKMGLSEASVKNTVQRLFGKADVKTRSQLVRVALDGSWGIPKGLSADQHE